MKTKSEGNCCFAEFFGPQDAQKFRKLKRKYKPKSTKKMLSDANTTEEDKERLLRDWYACVDANSIEKQAVSSSSKNEKQELQASKCQAASSSKMEVIAEKKGVQASSSNELGCNDTCFFAALFLPEEKDKIVEIKNELGMEIVETEKQTMLEK